MSQIYSLTSRRVPSGARNDALTRTRFASVQRALGVLCAGIIRVENNEFYSRGELRFMPLGEIYIREYIYLMQASNNSRGFYGIRETILR